MRRYIAYMTCIASRDIGDFYVKYGINDCLFNLRIFLFMSKILNSTRMLPLLVVALFYQNLNAFAMGTFTLKVIHTTGDNDTYQLISLDKTINEHLCIDSVTSVPLISKPDPKYAKPAVHDVNINYKRSGWCAFYPSVQYFSVSSGTGKSAAFYWKKNAGADPEIKITSDPAQIIHIFQNFQKKHQVFIGKG